MDLNSMRFAKTHEWVYLDKDIATIGISDFAVKELTDVVHIELPNAGKTVTAGDEIGEIESVKAVSDLYAPVSGEIIDVNNSLEDDLGQLSDDPFGKGWIVKIRVSDPSEVAQLMDKSTYESSCEAH